VNAPSRRGFLQTAAAGIASAPLILTTRGADSVSSTAASSKINVALVGAGGQGRGILKNLLSAGQHLSAICDPDPNQIIATRKDVGAAADSAKPYADYRDLLTDAKSFDAVLIATPDHWHAPLCKAFIAAGKHVYCEKPLTRTLSEARQLREFARANPKIITQMGNQGSAEHSLRRSVEVIRAGALGQVREVHSWLAGPGPGADRPEGEDPVPPGFNWDYWCGPSPYRPYKAGRYHPAAWRAWFDFGGGPLADFCCHIFNTALRSLDLADATKVEIEGDALARESSPKSTHVKLHFAARKQLNTDRNLEPVVLNWYDGGRRPSEELLKDVAAVYQKPPEHGCLIVGDDGIIWSNPWNNGALIKLRGEDKLRDINNHEPTRSIPQSLPRKVGHMQEWVNAIKGEGKPWSDFDFGARLTEIGLLGVLAMRLGHGFDWDGPNLKASLPQAAPLIRPQYRRAFLPA
jgi:predicted dehydrogenase